MQMKRSFTLRNGHEVNIVPNLSRGWTPTSNGNIRHYSRWRRFFYSENKLILMLK